MLKRTLRMLTKEQHKCLKGVSKEKIFPKVLKNDILPAIKTFWIDEIHNYCLNTRIASDRKKVSLVDYASFENHAKVKYQAGFYFEIGFEEKHDLAGSY